MRSIEIGDYIIGARIGSGGMASVYKAYHKDLDDDLNPDLDDPRVVVKIMNANLLDEPELRERFKNEAKSLRVLKGHPSIVNLERFDELDDSLCLFMDFVPGTNLQEAISEAGSKGYLKNPEKALPFFTKILEAIDFAHSKGFVHRDIKPGNIMVTSTDDPVILDFGIAKIFSENHQSATQHNAVMGSRSFMSPEQIRNPKNVDHRSDIYSLGVTLHYLLNGGYHYDPKETSDHDLTMMTLEQKLPLIGNMELDRVIQKATAKEPASRYANCQEFIRDLEMVSFTGDIHEATQFGSSDPGMTQFRQEYHAPVVEEPVYEPPQPSPAQSGIAKFVPYILGGILLLVLGFMVWNGKEDAKTETEHNTEVQQNDSAYVASSGSEQGTGVGMEDQVAPDKVDDSEDKISDEKPKTIPGPTLPEVKTYDSFEEVLSAMLKPGTDPDMRTALRPQLRSFIEASADIGIVDPDGNVLETPTAEQFVEYAASEPHIVNYELEEKNYSGKRIDYLTLKVYKQID